MLYRQRHPGLLPGTGMISCEEVWKYLVGLVFQGKHDKPKNWNLACVYQLRA